MKLYATCHAVRQKNCRDSLPFAPPPTAVGLSKKRPNVDTETRGDRLDIFNRTNNIELHLASLCEN